MAESSPFSDNQGGEPVHKAREGPPEEVDQFGDGPSAAGGHSRSVDEGGRTD